MSHENSELKRQMTQMSALTVELSDLQRQHAKLIDSLTAKEVYALHSLYHTIPHYIHCTTLYHTIHRIMTTGCGDRTVSGVSHSVRETDFQI